MKFRICLLAAIALVAANACARAGSTIDPTIPAQRGDLTSAPLRSQFNAARTDINNLLGQFAESNAPANPTVGQYWRKTNVTPNQVFKWTGTAWVQVETFDTVGGAATPFFGNRLLAWQQLIPGLGTNGQCLVFTGASTNPTAQSCLNATDITATAPVVVSFAGVSATLSLNLDSNFAVASNNLALHSISAGNLLGNCGGSLAEPGPCSWNSFASQAIGTGVNSFPIYSGGAWGVKTLGTSVLDPGTGTLEAIVPVQTSTTASYGFAASDFFKRTRRSNAGSAMNDTLPIAGTVGLANGSRIQIANTDASASDTITAGAGTTILGSTSFVLGPGRDLMLTYDLANTAWRAEGNTSTALLAPNNLSELPNPATARTNLGLGSIALQNDPLGVAHGGTGTTSFTAGLPLIGNGTSPTGQGTVTGNTTKFATSSGALTPGDCISIDASGNFVDNGAGCGANSNTPHTQDFLAGTDFTAGTTTVLTLSSAPSSTDLLFVSFDGINQAKNTWSLTGAVVTFNAAIPTGTVVVEAKWSTSSTLAGVGSINGLHGALTLSGGAGLGVANGAGVTVSDYVVPADYQAVCDGVTDDATALQNMINGSVAKTILIPAGTCVTGSTLNLPSGTTIIGTGWDSIIKSTVVNTPTFGETNVSNVFLSNFTIQGTNNSSGWGSASNFGALSVTVNNSAITTSSNIQFTKMQVMGYNATYWVKIDLSGASFGLTDVKFDDNTITSSAASVPTEPDPTKNSNYGFVFFSGTTQALRNASFSRNKIHATGMCFPMIFFGNVISANIDANEIDSAGQTSPTHCDNASATTINAYGIGVYDLYGNGNFATNYTIANNIINTPYGSGIYIVVGSSTSRANASIVGNVISDQTSTDNATLPRAAIALNGVSDLAVVGNVLNGNFGGIDISAVSANEINVIGNKCYTGNGDPNAHCFRLTPAPGASNTEIINFAGNTLNANTTGPAIVLIGSTTANRHSAVTIANNQIKANSTGIDGTSAFFSGPFTVTGNVFSGASSSTMAALRGVTGLLTVSNNIFDSSLGVSGLGLDVGADTVALSNNIFQNRASGSVKMYKADGACGTVQGMQFANVVQAAQVAASSLGLVNPSGCTLAYQAFVQNLAPTGTSSIVYGWLHTNTSPSTTHQALTFP